MKKYYFIIFAIILPSLLFGWERIYGTEEDYECCRAVTQLKDSCYVMVGSSTSCSTSVDDWLLYLIKVDRDGDTLWTRKYGDRDTLTSTDADGTSICATPDGGFAVTGCNIRAFHAEGVYLLRGDSNGDTLWVKTYDLGHSAWGYDIALTSDSGFVIAASGDRGACIVRTNSDGDSLWADTNSYHYMAGGYRVTETVDGGFVVGGSSGCRNLLWKLDSEGSTLWYRVYGTGESWVDQRYLWEIIADNDGGVVLVGYRTMPPDTIPTHDVYIMKVDSVGDSVWAYTYKDESQTAKEYMPSADRTDDGGFIIVATVFRFTSMYSVDSVYMYMVKTDSLGIKLWDKTITPLHYSDSILFAYWFVQQTYDKGFIISGIIEYGWEYRDYNNMDYYLIKTDSLGNSIPDAISETTNFPENFLISSYPNPFNSAVSISVPENAIVKIFNINGRCIAEFDGGDQIWKPEASVGSGIYLVRARFDYFDKLNNRLTDRGDESVTKRIVYLK